MANKDLIRYDLLVQDALKGVVRKVLTDAGKEGLPGEHHFYVSFRTDFAGVRVSQRLRDKYPQEMTIVLQHQFWDLRVTEHTFEVGLSFSGVPERLLVPFDSLTGFFDPSVQFGLKFELQGDEEEDAEGDPAEPVAPTRPAAPIAVKPAKPAIPVAAKSALPKLATKPAEEPEKERPKPAPEKPRAVDKPADKDAAAGSADVVSLDSFRKKN